MKAGLILLLIHLSQVLIAQGNNDTVVNPNIRIDKMKERQEKLKIFADSLNNYEGGAIPTFLFDKCFDLQKNLWEGAHSPVSLRWKVLEKVYSRQVLRMILNKQKKKLKEVCNYDKDSNPEITIPMIKKSFSKLIKKRYNQLR
jgi:hypothetical protein